MDVVAGLGYKGEPGKRHRVMMRFGDKFYPLLWFIMGKDGSLYLGPYNPEATPRRIDSWARRPSRSGTLDG